jgi:hypothetical protein
MSPKQTHSQRGRCFDKQPSWHGLAASLPNVRASSDASSIENYTLRETNNNNVKISCLSNSEISDSTELPMSPNNPTGLDDIFKLRNTSRFKDACKGIMFDPENMEKERNPTTIHTSFA